MSHFLRGARRRCAIANLKEQGFCLTKCEPPLAALQESCLAHHEISEKPALLRASGDGGQAGVILFGISRRAYGDDATAFLAKLKAARPADIDALADAPLPAVALKE